jgi:hypothetical protein
MTAEPKAEPERGPMITVHRCPVHQQFWSLCVDRHDGSGVRVLGGKCCHLQYKAEQVAWRLTEARRNELVEAMDAALEDAGAKR